MHTHPAAPLTNPEPPQSHIVADRPDSLLATEPTAKPEIPDDKAPGLRLHQGPPNHEKYRDGYLPTPSRMFGSGN